MCKSLCGMLRGAITWLNETKWPFEKYTKTESFYNIVPEGDITQDFIKKKNPGLLLLVRGWHKWQPSQFLLSSRRMEKKKKKKPSGSCIRQSDSPDWTNSSFAARTPIYIRGGLLLPSIIITRSTNFRHPPRRRIFFFSFIFLFSNDVQECTATYRQMI